MMDDRLQRLLGQPVTDPEEGTVFLICPSTSSSAQRFAISTRFAASNYMDFMLT